MRTPLALLLTLSAGTPAVAAAQARQLEATLALSKPAALARVQSVFADQQLPITSATGDVIEGRRTDKLVTLRFLATAIPIDSAQTRVVLTAFGTRPAFGAMPQAEAQVTEKSGGAGTKAWAELQRLRAALAEGQPVRKDVP